MQRLVGLAGQAGIAPEQARRAVARHFAQLAVANRVGDAKGRLAALPLAEQIAHSPQLQVGLRDPEAVVGAHEYLETVGDLGAHVAEQDAEALLGAAAHAAAQLMELREAEAFGVLDEHHGRVRDVDADLDHRRRNEDVDLAVAESAHGIVLRGRVEAAVQERHSAMRKATGAQILVFLRRGTECDLVALLDQRQHDVRLTGFRDLRVDEVEHLRARLLGTPRRRHRLAARRTLVEHTHVEVAVQRERERPRNRRGAHQQHVGTRALLAKREALLHAEPMLFVHHSEAESRELRSLLRERVRADDDQRLATREPRRRGLSLAGRERSGDEQRRKSEGGEE